MAANRYENAEKVKELLDEKQLGQLQKRIFSTEKSLSEILRKLSALEADRAEKEALAREEAAQSGSRFRRFPTRIPSARAAKRGLGAGARARKRAGELR